MTILWARRAYQDIPTCCSYMIMITIHRSVQGRVTRGHAPGQAPMRCSRYPTSWEAPGAPGECRSWAASVVPLTVLATELRCLSRGERALHPCTLALSVTASRCEVSCQQPACVPGTCTAAEPACDELLHCPAAPQCAIDELLCSVYKPLPPVRSSQSSMS